MSDDKLEKLLRTGTVDDCVTFFHGMTEERRRELAPQCLRWAKQVKANRVVQPDENTLSLNDRLAPSVAAVYATGTLSDVKQSGWRWFHDSDQLEKILVDRRPAWIDAWIAMILEDAFYWGRWRLVRRLIRAGAAARPTHPNYYLGMISGIRRRHDRKVSLRAELLADPELLDDELWRLFEYEGGGENSLQAVDASGGPDGWTGALIGLMRDGRLSRDRLLDSTLAALARDFNHFRARWFSSFYDALEPTADEAAQHAERLLELLRASAPTVASWAFDKVEAAARQGAYAADQLTAGLAPVLQAKAKGIVKRALQLLEAAAHGHPEAAVPISLAVADTLAHDNAYVQASAIKTLAALGAARDPQVAARLAKYAAGVSASVKKSLAQLLSDAAAPAKASASSDTKKSAAATTPRAAQRTPEKESSRSAPAAALAAALSALDVAALSPTIQSLFALDRLVAQRQSARLSLPAATFDGTDIARLAGCEPLRPIQDCGELLETLSRVIENESLVDDAERCFDGLSRLCDQKSDDFARQSAPLLKRVKKLIETKAPPFIGIGPWDDLCGLVLAWLAGIVLRPKAKKERMVELIGLDEELECFGANRFKGLGFLSQRSLAIAERLAAGTPAPLLSAPTHAGGWIAAQELVRRTNDWTGSEPHETDVVLALLRLAPDGRESALRELAASRDEWRQAVRYALGGDTKLGDRAAYWVAAARARAPWTTDPHVERKFPDRGPDAGTAADYEYQFKVNRFKHAELTLKSVPPAPKTADPSLPTVILHSQRSHGADLTFELGGAGGKTVGAVRWSSMIWPVARESYFAAAWDDLVDNLDWHEANWQFRAYLEPLLDSGTPLRKMGLLVLISVLAAKEPGEQGLATDAAIRAIEDGRLGGDNLGHAIERLLPTGLIKAGRWQKSLGEIARTSPVHAAVVYEGLQHGLRGDLAKLPKDVAKLLELLVELAHELNLPVQDEDCRKWLTSLGTAGKGGKLARELLGLKFDDSADRVAAIHAAAIDLRIAAARRGS